MIYKSGSTEIVIRTCFVLNIALETVDICQARLAIRAIKRHNPLPGLVYVFCPSVKIGVFPTDF